MAFMQISGMNIEVVVIINTLSLVLILNNNLNLGQRNSYNNFKINFIKSNYYSFLQETRICEKLFFAILLFSSYCVQ